MKLHIYQKGPKDEWDTKIGDGDGTPTDEGPFDVAMTAVSITIHSGRTYQIRQGSRPTGDLYNCLQGASSKNDTARFEKV